MRFCILLLVSFTIFIGTGLAVNVDIGNVDAFKQALEKDGFTVQEGELGYFDFIKLYNEGVLPSAYGNNPTTKYVAYFVPPAPGHKVDEKLSEIASTLGMSGNTTSFWNQGPDEAVVFVGRTPPECRFFNFDLVLMFRTYGNETRWIFAPPVDPLNMDVIKTEGTPDGSPGNPYNQTTMVVTTADKGIDQRIRAAAQSAGYSEGIINTHVLPSAMLNLGLENNSDVFGEAIRPALVKDKQSGDDYVNNTPAVVLRITPNESSELEPYDVPVQRVRGTGTTEFDLMDDLEELKNAIISKHNGSTARELPTSICVPDGADGIQRGINVIGPNNDCCYLWTATQPVESPTAPFFNTSGFYPFLQDSQVTLGDDPDEFIIVYGINHVATGKATYSNFAVYGADVWNGIKAITDIDFNGTAEEYLPDNPNAKYLYVYKLARNCNGDQHCFEVPYGKGGYGIDLDQPLFIAWRVYHEKATKTGPAYSEIVYDRAIKFDPEE
ncbi:MAG: hypothetical protein ACP5PV_09725 [Methanothrix sp.]|nr:hypothetical protein [Methanothrix sp.]